MRFGRFLRAWVTDWIALMSGIASVVLLIWATLWPPSQDQLKHGLFAVSVACFVFGSYRIWSAEHQRWADLTGKTQGEAFEDMQAEFDKLEEWYGSDETTKRRPLDRLIEKSLDDLRHHAPDYVVRFKKAVTNPTAYVSRSFPQRNRTMAELVAWQSNKEREACWFTVSACLYELANIKRDVAN